MKTIEVTLHARHSERTAATKAARLEEGTVLLSHDENERTAREAELPRGDWWHHATDSKGKTFTVFVGDSRHR